MTYHEALEHCIISLVASVEESPLENIEGLLPVTLSAELVRLLESCLGGHIVTLLVVGSVCHLIMIITNAPFKQKDIQT